MTLSTIDKPIPEILREKGREKQKQTLKQNTTVLSTIDKTENHDTRQEVAKDRRTEHLKKAFTPHHHDTAPAKK